MTIHHNFMQIASCLLNSFENQSITHDSIKITPPKKSRKRRKETSIQPRYRLLFLLSSGDCSTKSVRIIKMALITNAGIVKKGIQ